MCPANSEDLNNFILVSFLCLFACIVCMFTLLLFFVFFALSLVSEEKKTANKQWKVLVAQVYLCCTCTFFRVAPNTKY